MKPFETTVYFYDVKTAELIGQSNMRDEYYTECPMVIDLYEIKRFTPVFTDDGVIKMDQTKLTFLDDSTLMIGTPYEEIKKLIFELYDDSKEN